MDPTGRYCNVNFSDIAKKLASIGVPLLANAIVPGGGAVVSMVASALGLSDSSPDSVALALQTDPEAAVKLKQIEATHSERLAEIAMQGRQAEMAAETAQQQQINETMRAEYQADGWFKTGWRPLFGYMAAVGCGGILAAIVYSIFKVPGNTAETLNSAVVIIGIMLTVLGVNIKKRSDDKARGDSTRPLGILEALTNRIAK